MISRNKIKEEIHVKLKIILIKMKFNEKYMR